MREHPILFSGAMVRAILEGRKTETRRVVKPQPNSGPNGSMVDLMGGEWGLLDGDLSGNWRCPYGQPGDRLWVRETWRHTCDSLEEARALTEDITSGTAVGYRATYVDELMRNGPMARADAEECCERETWKPPIHMPRWASRITLEITDVRVQRVQDISEEDARAEGVLWVPGHGEIERADLEEGYSNYLNCRDGFQVLWDSINAKRGFGWNENPYVWALTFKRVEQSQ